MTDAENIEHAEHAGNDTAERADVQAVPADFEPLTATYERLRHSTDAAELSEFARRPFAGPCRTGSILACHRTAGGRGRQFRILLLEDRIFLAETMPFPNILVKLSTDESVEVRQGRGGQRR